MELTPFDTTAMQEFAGDGLKEFTCDTLNPLMDNEGPDLDDQSQDRYRGLDTDLSFLHTPRERSYIDLLQVKAAKDHIQRLPSDGESIHGVVSGRYPLFAIVPSILELAAPATIDKLTLVTLSYSRDNAHDLIELFDAGKIKSVSLMTSHYFAAQNPHLYDPLLAEMVARGQRMIALRTHAKIILARMSDGITYVVESSANLRSCKNIEQFVFTRCDELYHFHSRWINGLFTAAEKTDNDKGE